MAHFKIELLTHVTDRKSSDFNIYYLTSTITDFIAQTKDPQHFTTNLSFNEKFSLHANGQKELTFSMVDKLFYNNEWIDNPYPHNLHIGSQLLLTDKYQHEYLMTISKISFQIQELNITYQYTCQDSFSYQAMNQNQGYDIENDPTSTNFLGAKTLDDWSKKIIEECYHTYTLLDTNTGLYIDFNNNLQEFSEYAPYNVQKIIKPIYRDDYFHQLFTFSCSGSNAVAALIALGEKIDCVIHTYEKSYRTADNYLKLNKYIWFEPKRNPLPTGLKYTPNIDLQSFNFSLNGSNLATVLNITPNHIGEEIVSVFPTVPAFFQTWFQSNDWINSRYTRNMFTKKLLGIQSTHKGQTEFKTINEQDLIICPLNNLIISESYPIVNFNQEDNYSIIDNTRSNADIFKLVLPYETSKFLIVDDHEAIPQWWFTTEHDKDSFYVAKNKTDDDTPGRDYTIFLNFTRLYNEEEYAFASIADQCPWLESKLIDLNYALAQKIISVDEYQDIYDFLNNDIRIINGQLMAYSQSYYLEVHKSTKIVAKYTAKVDEIGAIINDLINTYAEQSAVDEKISDKFEVKYSELFKVNLSSEEEPTSLINYNDLISDYFNKTFNANQNFFKYTKQFRDYFESHDNFTAYADTQWLTDYTITADIPENATKFFTFQQSDFESLYQLNDDKKTMSYRLNNWEHMDIYQYQNNSYIKVPLADTKKDIYVHKDPELILANGIYNNTQEYFITTDKYREKVNSIIPENRYQFVQNNISYIELLPSEIKLLILEAHASNQEYYIRRQNIYTPFDWIRYNYTCDEKNNVQWGTFKALQHVDITKIPIPTFLQSNDKDATIAPKYYYQSYISSLPIDYIYYYGPKHRIVAADIEQITKVDIKTNYQVEHVNEYNYNYKKWEQLVQKYKEEHLEESVSITNPSKKIIQKYGHNPTNAALFQQIPFVTNIPSTDLNLSNFNLDSYLDNTQKITNAFIYYSACKNKDAVAVARNTGIAGTVLGSLSFLFPGLLLPALAVWATSITYTQLAKKVNDAQWLSNEVPYWIFEPTLTWSLQDEKYLFTPTGTDKGYIFPDQKKLYDSSSAIFGRTADAFNTMVENTIIGAEQSTLINLTETSTNLNGNKYFFNYYGLIAATYSFEYKDPSIDNNLIKAYENDEPAYTNYDEEGNITTDKEKIVKSVLNYHLWIKNNSYSRILTEKDTIYKYDKYYLVLLNTEGEISDNSKWSIFNEGIPTFNPLNTSSLKFSNIQFYWLPKVLLDLSIIPDTEWVNDQIAINKLGYQFLKDDLTRNQEESEKILFQDLYQISDQIPFIFKIDNICNNKKWTDHPWICILVHDEPYETQIITNGETQHTSWDNYFLNYKEWNEEPLYNISSHAPVNLLKESIPQNLLYTYKTYKNIDDSYRLITDEDLNNTDGKNHNLYFMYKHKDDYYHTYSIQQIDDRVNNYNNSQTTTETTSKDANDLYPLYIKNNQYYQKSFLDKNHNKFLINLYKHDIEYDVDHFKIIRHTKTPVYNQEFSFEIAEDAQTARLTISDENHEYDTDFILTKTIGQRFSNLSNGEIWYQFHNTPISSSLVEQANMIEVQLNEAWNNAVSASKMSNYFLPNSWKPTDNEQSNAWMKQLWNIDNENHITLSYNILPQVLVYKAFYKGQYTEILPKYTLIYNIQDTEDKEYIDIHNDLIVNNLSLQHHFELNNYQNENWNNWHLQPNGTCTYYYLQSSNQGILWKNLLSDTILKSTNNQSKTLYDNFDGWYPMMYKIFRTRFSQLEELEYLDLQETKIKQWAKLYKAYPNIFLEKSYTNPDATTSQELLDMATLAFKDQLKPEEAYNLTVLDIASIKGYNGQELNIGDSIQLDTETLYHNFDDIYNSLTKFLFISDISYDLRKDTDIQLTVNTIKYQEKLLQQLVKLIR